MPRLRIACVLRPTEIVAPNGGLTASFEVQDGGLYYAISLNGSPIVDRSKLQIIADAEVVIKDQSIRESDETWSPVYGQFSQIRNHYRELELSLTVDDVPMTLLCRAFDTGVGLRFIASQESAGKKLTFTSDYKLLNGVAHYAGERGYRSAWPGSGVDSQAKSALDEKIIRPTVPLVSVRENGQHVALLQSDLYSAAGFKVMKLTHQTLRLRHSPPPVQRSRKVRGM